MKTLVASFAAVAMFVGFAATSTACDKDGKCVGKSSSACCMTKAKSSGCCSTKGAKSASASKKSKKDVATTTAAVKVSESSAK
ncbi:MAG: hypothetical protein JNL32_05085 [Candidatus Kapabacteria bacterium]|nr:hypothetical protein [Candidatus Kapabacteria bacterium]